MVIKGDNQLADDVQNIKSISFGGSLIYLKNKHDLKVETDSKGNFTCKLNGNQISGTCSRTTCNIGLRESFNWIWRRCRKTFSKNLFNFRIYTIDAPGWASERWLCQRDLSSTLKNEKLYMAIKAGLANFVQSLRTKYRCN